MGLDLVTVSYMAFNFLSSIGIIFVNKLIFKQYNFHFATFVTSLHFVFTWLRAHNIISATATFHANTTHTESEKLREWISLQVLLE
jgi:hypothetical protein